MHYIRGPVWKISLCPTNTNGFWIAYGLRVVGNTQNLHVCFHTILNKLITRTQAKHFVHERSIHQHFSRWILHETDIIMKHSTIVDSLLLLLRWHLQVAAGLYLFNLRKVFCYDHELYLLYFAGRLILQVSVNWYIDIYDGAAGVGLDTEHPIPQPSSVIKNGAVEFLHFIIDTVMNTT